MILADKIIMLRKKNGWSQEELASELSISRQSVSKWESGASIPDLDKVLKLSQIFGVSTDYLLKDQMEEIDFSEADEPDEAGRHVSMEEADRFLSLTERLSKQIGAGVALFILSPICILLLAALAESGKSNVTENMAGGFGAAIILILVAIGVVICIISGVQLSRYEYLEKEELSLPYGVASVVEKKKEQFRPAYQIRIALGVALCILGSVPLLLAAAIEAEKMYLILAVCALLFLVATGVFLFIWAGMIQGSFDKLLQQGDYTSEQKRLNRKISFFPGIYWCIITAIYLAFSFTTEDWGKSWIIWPVAGVLFAAIQGILQAVLRSRE